MKVKPLLIMNVKTIMPELVMVGDRFIIRDKVYVL